MRFEEPEAGVRNAPPPLIQMKTPSLDQLLRASAQQPGIISFAGGLPSPQTFPREAMAAAAQHAIFQLQDAVQYSWPEGREELRTQIANRLKARGADVTPDDVIVTNGAQEGLTLVMELLSPKTIQVDSETYPGALDVFRKHECIPLTKTNQSIRYCMPAMHNPLGSIATVHERAEYLGAQFVVEDDAYAEVRFDSIVSRPLLADARSQVFHVGSFSKILSPALRVGWLVPPREWLKAAREAKSSRDLQASGLSQAIVEHVLNWAEFDKRLESIRKHYQHRANRLIAALRQLENVQMTSPLGAFSVWLETSCTQSDEVMLKRALDAGVAYDPGCLFRPPSDSKQTLAMRVSFSSVPLDQMEQGVERLQRVLHSAS